MFYKTEKWGFSLKPQATTTVWTVEAHISFVPTGEKIKVSLAAPEPGNEFKILAEDVVAKNYAVEK